MPDDRLIHKRACHSKKVSSLTDFEHRVWWTYQLIADDYGVMRMSAAALQSGNDALEKKTTFALEHALGRLVSVGLNRTFSHQGKSYLYQHDWQEWQRIRHPRPSVLPLPSLDDIEACEESTRALMRNRLEFTGEVLGDSSNVAATFPPHGKRLTANGIRLTAFPDRDLSNDLRSRFERFWASYPRKVGKGAAWRVWVRLAPDEALTSRMIAAVAVQAQTRQWRKDGGQFVPHPSTWLNQERWEDSPEIEVDPTDPFDGLRKAVESG